MVFPSEHTTMNEQETLELARRLGRTLVPGDVVALIGPLGAGKTVFVRGLAEGAGADPAEVCSPTFALLHEYGGGSKGSAVFVHLDLYRLRDEERELREIGLPELLAGRIAAVEWPGPAAERLLTPTYTVRLQPEPSGARRIRLEKGR